LKIVYPYGELEETVVAEFERSVSGNTFGRAMRIWNTTITGSERENLGFLLKQIDDIRITFNAGYAEYYMGDLENSTNDRMYLLPQIVIRNPSNSPVLTYMYLEEAQEVLTQYGITLISWEISEPIINNFGD
jgi:hypothetical protein